MSEYKRITKRDKDGNIYYDGGIDTIKYIAEIEDKIESGIYLELPCFQVIGEPHFFKYQIVFRNEYGIICTERFKFEQDAKTRFEEVKVGITKDPITRKAEEWERQRQIDLLEYNPIDCDHCKYFDNWSSFCYAVGKSFGVRKDICPLKKYRELQGE